MFYNDKKSFDNQYGLWKDKDKKPLFDFGTNKEAREKKKRRDEEDSVFIAFYCSDE